jgi:hypothetical protein
MFSLMSAIFSWMSCPTVLSFSRMNGLLEQAHFGEVLLELALRDLLLHVRGLARGRGLGLVDLALLVEHVAGDLVLGHVEGIRRPRCASRSP